MAIPSLLLLFGCLGSVSSSFYLRQLSYTRLPATLPPRETFKMFAGIAKEAAYDSANEMLYVIGESSGLLHVLDIADPAAPRVVTTHSFDLKSDGVPHDVAVCGTELIVVLSSPVKEVYEGHIYVYHALQRGQTDLHLGNKMPVGPYPDMATFTPDCSEILVANEGRPGKDIGGKFVDPEGSVTMIKYQRTGNPIEQMVDFKSENNRYDLRFPSRYVPQNIWPLQTPPTFGEDASPEYIAVSPNGKNAYIVLQKNNAIATLSLSTSTITSVTPLANKDWSTIGIDPSDRDGGAHIRNYPFQSIPQPDSAKVLIVGKSEYLITADEGKPTTFTTADHGFTWSDHSLADTLSRAKKFDDRFINNETFISHLLNDQKAGRLELSTIDGYSLFTQKIEKPTFFGGRGFSIWNTKDWSRVYDSGDDIETNMALLFPDVFNSDCVPATYTYQSPANLKDTTSDNLGPKLNALDLVTDNGNTFLLLGSETVGALFLYTINTSSGVPKPKFESGFRAGLTDFVWAELYGMERAGDAYISAIGLIESSKHSANRTMAYVIGSASGTVSLYEIVQQSIVPPSIIG